MALVARRQAGSHPRRVLKAASIATGCHPARHGLEGNCMALDEGQGLEVISVGPPGFRDRLHGAINQVITTQELATM